MLHFSLLDNIILNLPWISSSESPGGEKFDIFYKGPFLIKRIRHDFNMSSNPQRHMMYMSLVKDSLEEKLEGPKDLKEPKPEQEPEIIRNKEIFYPQL